VHAAAALVKSGTRETGEREWSAAGERARVSGLMPRATVFTKPISTVFAARIKHPR
jgi:hypothetical protein